MNELSIEFCEDVKTFIKAQIEPSLKRNQRVLHLGCHRGNLAYELASIVGSGGRVIGLESHESTVYDVFRKHNDRVEKIGYDNVLFFHNTGKELRTDLYRQTSMMRRKTFDSVYGLHQFLHRSGQYFDANPVVEDNSIDALLITEYVSEFDLATLNDLASEMARVLKPTANCAVLLPATKTKQARGNIERFISRLACLGVQAERITDHWVQTGCCSENHYLMIHFTVESIRHYGVNFLNEKLTQLLASKERAVTQSDKACTTGSGCC